MNGARIVIECLKEQGVDTVFGFPGGTILNIYEELYKEKSIRHYLTAHEQGATHAADGYARATGRPGVVFTTSGPGATNMVTGIATAFMDSIPVIAITCNVSLPSLGKDSFQEVDITGITMPVTKHSFIVKDVRNLADTIRRAFRIALSGRPGPVVVDVTKDVTSDTWEFVPQEPVRAERVNRTTKEEIEKAVRLMSSAKKPYLYVGGGAVHSGAEREIAKFAETLDAPVCDTLLGRGAFDGTSSRYTGMIGMHGTKTSNFGVSDCDLLVALGARFDDRVTGDTAHFAEGAKIIHMDIDPAEINKNVPADLALIGDLRHTLQAVNRLLPKQRHASWMKKTAERMRKYPLFDPGEWEGLTLPFFLRALSKEADENCILVTEVGQHQMWTAQYYPFRKPRTLLTSGGLGTMGFGLGAALGAKVGNPACTAINIAGDGCFRMNMHELATASRYGIPIVEVVVNNGVLGMVRQWQTLFYHKHYAATVFDDAVDFCKVAEGLGCRAMRITEKKEVPAAVEAALKTEVPLLIDLVIDKDDSVFPMVAPGTPLTSAFDFQE